MSKPNIAIIGLGVIGGSYALALRSHAEIFGVDISAPTINAAINAGAISQAVSPERALEVADIVLCCLYPAQTLEFVRKYHDHFRQGTIFAEMCGLKGDFSTELALALPKTVEYVPCHPMAGKQAGGFAFASADIFAGSSFIICPLEDTSEQAIQKMSELARLSGAATITICDARSHDYQIAYGSHLCHLSALGMALALPTDIDRAFTAGAFRDATRVADINPELWAQLFLHNSHLTLAALDDYISALTDLKTTIASADKSAVVALLARAAAVKRGL